MKIRVEQKDQSGYISDKTFTIGKLGLIKHFAVAGQRFAPKSRRFLRGVGMLLQFNPYLDPASLDVDRFSGPPSAFSDPTEKAQFSNIVGKGIADFLVKRIDNCLHTTTYEAAMREKGIKIEGSRPDLIAFSPPHTTISMEAKGYSGSYGDMAEHKLQAEATHELIPSNMSVACVSYNLYGKIRTKYHDPYNELIRFDDQLFSQLTARYYSGLLGFLDQKHFDIEIVGYGREEFYEVRLPLRQIERFFGVETISKCLARTLAVYNPRIILPKRIHDYAHSGVPRDVEGFRFEETESIYIDRDRVGLRIGEKKVPQTHDESTARKSKQKGQSLADFVSGEPS